MSTTTRDRLAEVVDLLTRAAELVQPADATTSIGKAATAIAVAAMQIAEAGRISTCDIDWCQSYQPNHTEHEYLESAATNEAGSVISVGLMQEASFQAHEESFVLKVLDASDDDGGDAYVLLNEADVRRIIAAFEQAIARRNALIGRGQ